MLGTPPAHGESEGNVFSLKDLETLMEFFLTRQIYKDYSCDPIIVFVLPDQLLNHDFERIKIKIRFYERTIGSNYYVYIRSLERFKHFFKDIHHNPEEKQYDKPYNTQCIENWKLLNSSCEIQCHDFFVDVSNFNNHNKLLADLEQRRSKKKAIALKSNTPPCVNIIEVINESATPVALWLKKNDFKTINCQEELDKLLNCKINELPEKVKQQRSEAFGEGNKQEHIGHHLALLWEDPYLLPPQINYTTI
ncbi:MAG: hypothetical protein F6K10_35705 [Moorea sp. SIO2B7]|nr:hypothetical protein [Moorena sp. SIO2B7]